MSMSHGWVIPAGSKGDVLRQLIRGENVGSTSVKMDDDGNVVGISSSNNSIDATINYKRAPDLAHGSVMYTSPFVNSEYLYDDATHAFFEKNGYCFLRNFLRPKALTFLQEQVQHVYENLHPCVQKAWIMNLHQVLPDSCNWMWKLASEPALLRVINRHLGDNYVFNSAQVLIKPPICHKNGKGGGIVPWHQDGQILRTIWICLDDIDAENGGLKVKPGWHRRGHLRTRFIERSKRHNYFSGMAQFKENQQSLSNLIDKPPVKMSEIDFSYYHKQAKNEKKDGLNSLEIEKVTKCQTRNYTKQKYQIEDDEWWNRDVEQYNLRAGDAAMHHPATPHCSAKNSSTKNWRRIIILRYLPANYKKPVGKLHQHWATGQLYHKQSFLVSGEDVNGQGFKKTPLKQ